MPDILNTSLTGMLAFQRALQVTSHNIANANTPGYSRQVAEFSTRPGSAAGNLFLGGGTQISNIRRIYDGLQNEQLRTSTTGFARFDTLNTLSGRIDTLLADGSTGLNASIDMFGRGRAPRSNRHEAHHRTIDHRGATRAPDRSPAVPHACLTHRTTGVNSGCRQQCVADANDQYQAEDALILTGPRS